MVNLWMMSLSSLALGNEMDQGSLLQVQRKTDVQRGQLQVDVEGGPEVWVRTCREREEPESALRGSVNVMFNDGAAQRASCSWGRCSQGWKTLKTRVPADVQSVSIEATEKDAWCFDQVLIGPSGNRQLFHIGAQWLSTACDEVSHTPCESSVRYLQSNYGADVVKVHTTKIAHANSNGHFYISINEGPEYLLDSPKNDFEKDEWDEFYIPAIGGDVVNTVDIHCRDTDGWAFDEILVDGQSVHKGTQWLDNAKVTKKGEKVWGDSCPDKHKSKIPGYNHCVSKVSYEVKPPEMYGTSEKGEPCNEEDGWLPVTTQAQCKAANTFLKETGLEIGEVKARPKQKNPPGCYYLQKGDNDIHGVHWNKHEHEDVDAYWDHIAEQAQKGKKIKFGVMCWKPA